MPTLQKEDIVAILVDQSYVSAADMETAQKHAKKNHTDPIDYLFSEGFITEELMGQAMAEFYKIPYTNFKVHEPDKDTVKKIPQDTAKKYGAILIDESDKEVTVATCDPKNEELLTELHRIFKEGREIRLTYALRDQIQSAFTYYREALQTRFVRILEKGDCMAPEILEEILKDAISFNASDIHFEPQEDGILVRFRVDGILEEAGRLPKEYYENLINHIKVQSHLRTDEHASSQDGAIRYHHDDKVSDLRVSIVPVMDGEKVVIRLLSQYVRQLTFNDLGLLNDDQKTLRTVSKKAFGMVLVVGPTGSGKTTTLYSILKMLNRPDINIATIEDPVEYKIQGINHIQVNPKSNLTFTQGIKSLVRQDPDVILVGEIRDPETAEIAINAALTGHLLFSTFHSNDAATAIPRLMDMGVEPFLLSSTLEIIVSQRLCRRICTNCLHSVSFAHDDLEKYIPGSVKYFPERKAILYEGKGCRSCHQTGYKGRIAIFEIISMTQEIKDMVLKNPSSHEIWKLAREQGARSMFEDGLEKVKNGLITLEELTRVASPRA